MRPVTNNKLTKALCVALILLVSTPSVFAYPPDNAAVLYYRACHWYTADETMENALRDLSKGSIEVDEKIKKFVGKNRNAIDFAIDAADVPNCDWGLDYSKGISMVFLPLGTFRKMGWVILGEAEIFAGEGDYKSALEHCLSVKKMARHLSETPLVTFLVAVALNNLADNSIMHILADMPGDLKTLNWFRNQLVDLASRPLSVKAAVSRETKVALVDMRVEMIDGFLEMLSDEKSIAPSAVRELWIERIRAADGQFFESNRDYYENWIADIQAAMDLPYPQAYIKLTKLVEKPQKDATEDPNAILTAILFPALGTVHSIMVKAETLSNAVRAAVEIYIIKAKTGRLPDNLPIGLPKDLFSGKDFEYIKTGDGFILRCQGRDLRKDKIHEYKFKIKK